MATPSATLYSRNYFDANGIISSWEFTFQGGYLDQSHVKAFYEDKTTGDITLIPIRPGNFPAGDFIGPSTLYLNSPRVPANSTLCIYRDTPKDALLVSYVQGARLDKANLDLMSTQTLFVAVEALDLNTTGDFGPAIQAAADAATQALLTANAAQTTANSLGTQVASAVTTAGNAQTAAGNAQTTANTANTAAGNATTAAGTAQTTANNAATAAGTAQTAANLANTNLNTRDLSKNYILNGQFNIWQRPGITTQTTSAFGEDRWFNGHNGSSKTHTQQAFTLGQTAVPSNPVFYSRTVVTSTANSANYVNKSQRIEDVRRLGGKTVTVAFWAKADSAKSIAMDFRQFFGTGGSADVTAIGAQKFVLSTAWQRFTADVPVTSVAGKTIGSTTSFTELTFWFDAGSSFNTRTATLGQQSGTFEIANVQVTEQTLNTTYPVIGPEAELVQCLRYLHVGSMNISSYQSGGNQAAVWCPLGKMGKVPTVSLSGSASYNNASALNFDSQSTDGYRGIFTVTATGGANVSFTIIADAELT